MKVGIILVTLDTFSMVCGVDVLPDTVLLRDYLYLKDFDSSELSARWDTFYADNIRANTTNPAEWSSNINYLLESALLTNSTVVLKAIMNLDYPDYSRRPVFDRDMALYMVAKNYEIDDTAAGQMARILIEYGAVPMRTGFNGDSLFANMTAVEIAIRQERPSVVQAMLMEPSPLHYETLEAMADASKDMRRGIEVFRTQVIREATDMYDRVAASKSVASTVKKSDISKLEEIIRILKEEKFYIFAETYLNLLILMLFFVIFVFVLIQFLFNLRVKRIPVDSQLSIPQSADISVWVFAGHFINTLCSTVPTASLFQTISLGIAFVGSLVWSALFTSRNDIFTVLVLSAVMQTVFTITCYYAYAPVATVDLEEEASLVKVMFYPKAADWNRAVTKSTLFLFSSSVSLFVFFTALDPVTRMYWCPSLSISDTYGFKWSWFRMFGICWDILIFFTLTLRIQRFIETITVYDLIGKSVSPTKGDPIEDIENIDAH